MSSFPTWHVCRNSLGEYLLVPVGDTIPDGWTSEAITAVENYIELYT